MIRPDQRASNDGSTGFTLLELSFVLLILGLTVALTLPAINSLYSRESDQAGLRRFTGVVRRGLNAALVSGQPQMILVDAAKHTMTLFPLAPDQDGKRRVEQVALPARFAPDEVFTPYAPGRKDKEKDPVRLTILPRELVEPCLLLLPPDPGGASRQRRAAVVETIGGDVRLLPGDGDAAATLYRTRHSSLRTPWADTPLPERPAG